MDWQIVVQVLGILLGGLISLYQIRQLLPISRSKLKADLEILKLLDENDAAHKIVKEHIDRSIMRTYSSGIEEKNGVQIQWPLLIFFLAATIGLVYWTLYLVRDGFNPWSLLTGIFGLVSVFGLIGSLLPEKKQAAA